MRTVVPWLVLCLIATAELSSQQRRPENKPVMDLVTVVGCAARGEGGAWMLNNAGAAEVTKVAYISKPEVEAARKKPLGRDRYRLIGTADFVTIDELLKDPVRSQITDRAGANATGQLQEGRKIVIKGLLINAPQEKRLNLTAVQQLADNCK